MSPLPFADHLAFIVCTHDYLALLHAWGFLLVELAVKYIVYVP